MAQCSPRSTSSGRLKVTLCLALALSLAAIGVAQAQPKPAPQTSRCAAAISPEAQRLIQVASDPAAESATQTAALAALRQLPGDEAPCALASLLCTPTGLPGDLRNRLELELVDLAEASFFALAYWLDSGLCPLESASTFFSRIMRRLPELLPGLCNEYGMETCSAVAQGIALSGHPATSDTLAALFQRSDKASHKAAIFKAACPQAAEACAALLAPSLAVGTAPEVAAAALETLGSLRRKELSRLAAPWLTLDTPDLLLIALEGLSAAGSQGLEQSLFDLLIKAPAPLRDPILLALAAGDPELSRPLLQRAFAATPPSSPEQQRLAQWLLADTPDILFRGNTPETTPVFAQAAPNSKATCLLTLRNQEGLKVAVDGKLRLVCASSSKTYVYEQNRFNDAGVLEFPCLCDASTRPDAAWITTEDVILPIQWK